MFFTASDRGANLPLFIRRLSVEGVVTVVWSIMLNSDSESAVFCSLRQTAEIRAYWFIRFCSDRHKNIPDDYSICHGEKIDGSPDPIGVVSRVLCRFPVRF